MKFVPVSNPIADTPVSTSFSRQYFTVGLPKLVQFLSSQKTSTSTESGNHFTLYSQYPVMAFIHCAANDDHNYQKTTEYVAFMMGAYFHAFMTAESGFWHSQSVLVADFNDCDKHFFSERDMQATLTWFSDSLRTNVKDLYGTQQNFNVALDKIYRTGGEANGDTSFALCWMNANLYNTEYDDSFVAGFVSGMTSRMDRGKDSWPGREKAYMEKQFKVPEGNKLGASFSTGELSRDAKKDAPDYVHLRQCHYSFELMSSLLGRFDYVYTSAEWGLAESVNQVHIDEDSQRELDELSHDVFEDNGAMCIDSFQDMFIGVPEISFAPQVTIGKRQVGKSEKSVKGSVCQAMVYEAARNVKLGVATDDSKNSQTVTLDPFGPLYSRSPGGLAMAGERDGGLGMGDVDGEDKISFADLYALRAKVCRPSSKCSAGHNWDIAESARGPDWCTPIECCIPCAEEQYQLDDLQTTYLKYIFVYGPMDM